MARTVAAVLIAAMMLAGCGGRPDAADPVLWSALAGTPPHAAADPRALARQITVAEAAVRNRTSSPAVVAAAGWTAQVAYFALADRPDWDAVLAEVPGQLRDAARRSVAAGRELRAMATRAPPPALPAWRIVTPIAAPQLRAYYAEAQQRFGVPWQVLAAVHLVETRMGRIVGLSTAGAQGPMQFLPATWARYGLGGDVWNPRDAILGAANYLAAGGATAGGTGAGLDHALYRYNNDVQYVRAVRDYAARMQADERAYLGLHAWHVYYRTDVGDVLLLAGYESARPVPVREWLATRPR
ncbi:MAG: lytic murein transglycosylase [Pseudonocardiaceae bacterium]